MAPVGQVGEEGGHEKGLQFEEEDDEDGIPLRTIERRFDRIQSVDEWYVEIERLKVIWFARGSCFETTS